jgi:integrase
MRARIPGVNTVPKRLASGEVKTYYYHRATETRLPGKPGSKEFLAAFAAAEATLKDRLQDVYAGLIRAYTLSPEFRTKLAPSTQAEYRRMLTKSEAKFATLPVAALEDREVRRVFLDWRAEVFETSGPREADNRLSAISAMLTWAVERAWLSTNHLAGFKRLYSSNRAEKIWLPEHVDAFWSVASVEMQRALFLALHTGQRQGDILKLTWSNYDGTFLTFRQGKSARNGRLGNQVVIRCTKALQRMLDSLPRDGLLILSTSTGRPWTARHFGKQWELAATKAGITDLHFHDLRGTSVTLFAENKCTTLEIAAITGHSFKTVNTIIEKYLPRTRVLADQAIFNWENGRATDFANRLQTRTPKPRRETAK